MENNTNNDITNEKEEILTNEQQLEYLSKIILDVDKKIEESENIKN